MNIAALHTAFKLELDKTNSLSYASFEPEEIDYWLNKAYLALVNQKMFGNNPRGEGFDMSQKREDDLRLLVLTSILASPTVSTDIANCVYSPLTNLSNYLYFISSRVIYTNGKRTVNLNISHNEKDKFIETDVNIPWIKHPVAFLEGSNVYVLYDRYAVAAGGYSITGLEVTYLRTPEALSINTPNQIPLIAEHVHPELASLAVFMAVENISSPRVQTNSLTLNKLE